MSHKTIEYADHDGIDAYQAELTFLMDVLEVEPEIRDGWYSDESRIGDLFSPWDPPEEVAAHLARLDLPAVDLATPLLPVLVEIRRLRMVH